MQVFHQWVVSHDLYVDKLCSITLGMCTPTLFSRHIPAAITAYEVISSECCPHAAVMH